MAGYKNQQEPDQDAKPGVFYEVNPGAMMKSDQKPSPVILAFDRLDHLIEVLTRELSQLHEHIQPVLGPEPDGEGEEGMKDSGSQAPIVLSLTQSADRIAMLIDRTRDLNSRVQL